MSPEREISTAELAEDVAELRRASVPREVYDAHRELWRSEKTGLELRIGALESKLSSVNRTAWTAGIIPIVSAIIVAALLAAMRF